MGIKPRTNQGSIEDILFFDFKCREQTQNSGHIIWYVNAAYKHKTEINIMNRNILCL